MSRRTSSPQTIRALAEGPPALAASRMDMPGGIDGPAAIDFPEDIDMPDDMDVPGGIDMPDDIGALSDVDLDTLASVAEQAVKRISRPADRA